MLEAQQVPALVPVFVTAILLFDLYSNVLDHAAHWAKAILAGVVLLSQAFLRPDKLPTRSERKISYLRVKRTFNQIVCAKIYPAKGIPEST